MSGVEKIHNIVVNYSNMRRSGSRLAAVLNVNKHPGAQINYGTGGDVS